MSEYKTTVGIEVHAELKTASKMFCGCKNDPHYSEPNKNICPTCTAQPGTLPVVNKDAIEKVLRVGLAIGAKCADFSEFDRKNYFYPDIPKAYQISQYKKPLVSGGVLAGVAITRIHLEEDTAKSQHEGNVSLVDFNRAGVPLMELVTEPVIHTAKEAGDFAKELQLLLQILDVSDANMEKGEMRVEANISVSNSGQLGVKVEVKNLNSFKAMEQAIEYETKRQIELLEKGEKIKQETRGWDEGKAATFSQRVKETADDYRYFPDPDIPKFLFSEVDDMNISRLAEKQPKLATEYRNDYLNLGIPAAQIEVIIANTAARNFFTAATNTLKNDKEKILLAANYLTSDIYSLLQEGLVLQPAAAVQFSSLITMISEAQINSRIAKDLLREVVFDLKDPLVLAKERNLLQQNSAGDLLPIVQKILSENAGVAQEFKAGKETALKYLIGQAMKETKGAANPKTITELIQSELKN